MSDLGHSPSGLQNSATLRLALLAALLVGAVILTYLPAWNAGFIWDDDKYVTHNPLVTAPDGLHRIWFSTDSPSQYFPLVYTNFRAQHSLWGLDPRGYHWVNILLHACNALLVWRLLFRLATPGAWFGAALFALHPLQVESVAWITELKNIQSLFFSLLVLLFWVSFIEKTSGQAGNKAAGSGSLPAPKITSFSWFRSPAAIYAAAIICHSLALFSKTTACTLPAAMVLVLWVQRRPVTLTRWLQVIPFILFGLVMGLVSVWWEHHQLETVGTEFAYGPLERVLIAARALCFYFGKLIWPADLTFSYSLWSIDRYSASAWAWFLPLGLIALSVFALRRRLGRGPEAALVFFSATLLPLLGFFMLYTFRYTFVADHYVYVALIGPAALAAAALCRTAPRLRALHAALPTLLCCALLLGLAVLSHRQSRMYKDLRTLWETTVARNPASYMAHNNLGAIDLAEGQIDDAIAHFERALSLKPDHIHALANFANARLAQGRTQDALALFHRVVEINPDDAKGWSDLGQASEQAGHATDAESHYRRALALNDKLAEVHFLLGRRLLADQRTAEASLHLERAVALHASYTEAHYHLGLVRLSEERRDAAETCFERVIALAPNHAFALHNLGLLLSFRGQPAEAEPFLQRAVRAAPSDASMRYNLSHVLLALDRVTEAESELREAIRLAPDPGPARIELAQIQIKLGRYPEAAATLEAHLARHPDDFEARHGLGRVLLAAGRPAEAAETFRHVLADAPNHADARADLERLSAGTSPSL